jgi:hypothetical protein
MVVHSNIAERDDYVTAIEYEATQPGPEGAGAYLESTAASSTIQARPTGYLSESANPGELYDTPQSKLHIRVCINLPAATVCRAVLSCLVLSCAGNAKLGDMRAVSSCYRQLPCS